MFGANNNIAAKIFQRQIRTPPPSTTINSARQFYENLVPSCTIYDVECPDNWFRKFTDDGRYLISFSRNHQDLVVFRTSWPTFSYKGEQEEEEEDCRPSKANRFDSFFTQLYSVPLASATEFICKDFFIYIQNKQFGLFATSTTQIHDAPPPPSSTSADGAPALQGVPYIEKITFHLLRLEDGVILDDRVFLNDYVNLTHSMGVYLYDDLLAIVSLRFQRIHILQIRDSGNLVDVRAIGEFCHEDDELFLNSNAQVLGQHAGSAPDDNQSISQSSFLSGIKQRLLSFIVRGIWTEETDPTLVGLSTINLCLLTHFMN